MKLSFRLRAVLGASILFSVGVGGFAADKPAAAASAAPAPAAPLSLGELRTRLDAHLGQARFASGLWSVKIASLDTGRVLFEHHADRLMSPASNSKLYTGAMALDVLGADYRIRTPVLASVKPDAAGVVRGDIVVSGRGDPSWKTREGSKNFWDAFEPVIGVLKQAGVKRVTGDLVADATWLRVLPNGAGWTADDLNDDYGAEVSAITLEDNYAELRLTPAATAGGPVQAVWIQPLTSISIDNRMTTTAAEVAKQIVGVRLFGETTVHLFGSLPLKSAAQVTEVTVPRPAQWYAVCLKEALARRGIVVEGAPRSLRWPDAPAKSDTQVSLGEVVSPPMSELVKGFMKPSQNLETDLIFDHVGERTRTATTPEWRTSEDLGVVALRDFLRKHNLHADDVHFEEGAGLSRNNLTSARATVALLTFMRSHPSGAEYYASLPIAGTDGTIKRRMKATAAEGNVRAKTGTLRYANSLSGYVTTAAGEQLVFSLMLNRNSQQPATRKTTEELDDIAVMLANLSERSPAASAGR